MALDDNRFIIRLVLTGTLIVSILLFTLLFVHDLLTESTIRQRSYIAIGGIVYLLATYIVYRKKNAALSSWMIIAFYAAVMCLMLLSWGLNAPVGILSVAFLIFLVGILFGPKAIIGMTVGISLLLALTHTLHETSTLSPRIDEINVRATAWDAASYIIIFMIFGLLSWVSSTRARKSLQRAQIAESSIRKQRNIIRAELKEEYARARQNRLIEIERLYKFATLGQSTAATLHELSNHLSVLNMDINDLTQQHKNSKAIVRAQESIEHITTMMRHVRRRLNIAQESTERFFVAESTQTAVQDVHKKFLQRSVTLSVDIAPSIKTATLIGDPLSWSHVVTILVTNALEACQDLVQPKVLLKVSRKDAYIIVSVSDNGVGIPRVQQSKLFQPVYSEKPNGMGVGLFIAKHIIEGQFKGTVTYARIKPGNSQDLSFESGSCFTITVPLRTILKKSASNES